MTVKIMTDSISDLPTEMVKELGITVIPLNVRFGIVVAVLGDSDRLRRTEARSWQ